MQRRHALAALSLPFGLSPLASASAAAAANAVPDSPGVPSSDGLTLRDLDEDLELLGLALREIHPGTYRYADRAALDAAEDAARRRWHASLDAPDAATATRRQADALQVLLTTIRCGHTFVNDSNQRQAARARLVDAPPRVPLHFAWMTAPDTAAPASGGEAAIVLRTAANVRGGPVAGSELLALDGVPMSALRGTLLARCRVDGNNRGAQLALLSPRGDHEVEAFDLLHAWQREGDAAGFRVRWRTPDGRVREAMLPAVDRAAREAMRPRPAVPAGEPVWRLEMPGEDNAREVAVLTMPGWALYDQRWDWNTWLDEAFARVVAPARAGGGPPRGLVIDLRGNEGGLDECGDALLARLVDQALDGRLFDERTRYRRLPAALGPHVDTWDDSFRDWGDRVGNAVDGFHPLRATEASRILPRGPSLRGRTKVVVLVDGTIHSSTFRFITLARRERMATLVGETSGGNQRGINGGAFFFLRLPHSGLEVDIPLIGYFARGRTPDGGLPPDVAIAPTAAQVASGDDPVLARGLAVAGA